MNKVRWGILSTAKIGVEKVIPAMQKSEYCDIRAIASSSLEKAEAVSKLLNIPNAYGSYEDLLNDKDIDAVYIPLPNHLHVSWAIKALEADKHVLCEKPIALSSEEAKKLLDFAKYKPHLKVMEAFMYRHHPQWQKAKQLVENGEIGGLQTIESVFAYYNNDPENIRNMADIGGGGLMDIGCYCISLSRFIFSAEPKKVIGEMKIDKNFNTDYLTSGILDFGNGTSAFTCSTQMAPLQRVYIYGTKGKIEIEIPFNAPNDKPCKIGIKKGNDIEEITFDICDQYTIQGELFSQAIFNDTDVFTPLEDAVANMKVIERIKESSKENKWN
ncbi:MAG: Gfo/Idh/MocA family oxidoreductase [Melioribacteraceae bacterium]|nr:Gfo/Idh/MocA family oxidoreductase [Melioribacteraceae bacterium]